MCLMDAIYLHPHPHLPPPPPSAADAPTAASQQAANVRGETAPVCAVALQFGGFSGRPRLPEQVTFDPGPTDPRGASTP